MVMSKRLLFTASAIILAAILSASCSSRPDVPIYTYKPDSIPPAASTPTTPAPVLGSPKQPAEQYVERNITVTEQNSVFSIGIPSGWDENTEVIAEKPLDYWFEYLPAEAVLEIDGKEIVRDITKWETKIAYTKSAIRFAYKIKNDTGQAISYNLHLLPSSPGNQVPVKINQRWIP